MRWSLGMIKKGRHPSQTTNQESTTRDWGKNRRRARRDTRRVTRRRAGKARGSCIAVRCTEYSHREGTTNSTRQTDRQTDTRHYGLHLHKTRYLFRDVHAPSGMLIRYNQGNGEAQTGIKEEINLIASDRVILIVKSSDIEWNVWTRKGRKDKEGTDRHRHTEGRNDQHGCGMGCMYNDATINHKQDVQRITINRRGRGMHRRGRMGRGQRCAIPHII